MVWVSDALQPNIANEAHKMILTKEEVELLKQLKGISLLLRSGGITPTVQHVSAKDHVQMRWKNQVRHPCIRSLDVEHCSLAASRCWAGALKSSNRIFQ